jgi:hypothetical protein
MLASMFNKLVAPSVVRLTVPVVEIPADKVNAAPAVAVKVAPAVELEKPFVTVMSPVLRRVAARLLVIWF